MKKLVTVLLVSAFILTGSSVLVSAQTSAEVDARAEINQSQESRENDLDSDGDGIDDAEEGEFDILDPDSDDDGLPAVVPGKHIDKASPKLMEVRAGGDDQTTPLLYQGLRVRGELCDADDDCNDDDAEVTPEEAQNELWVHVSGDDVRGMSVEAKTQVQERLSVAGGANTANDFGLRVASAAIENDSVTEIITNDTETEVHYTTRLRLFGFIPVTTTAVAEANTDGEVAVRYPWYRFLSRVQDESDMTSLALTLRSSHDALIAVE
jgi:hypothetical protein